MSATTATPVVALDSAEDASTSYQINPLPSPQKRQMARQLSSVFITSTMETRFKDRIRPTLILGFLHFKKPIDVEKIRQLTFERLVCSELRFRSKAVLDPAYPCYFDEIPLDGIDMEYHVQSKEARGWEEADIDIFMRDLYTIDMDPQKPLWVMYVLNDLADGRSCLVFVIDHAIGDGISLTNVCLNSLLDNSSGITEEPASPSAPPNAPRRNKNTSVLSTLEKIYYFCYGAVIPFVDLFLPGDDCNSLKMRDHRRPGMTKCGRSAGKISLLKVKEVKNKFPGATVNDVLTAVLNMAVRRYFEAERDPILSSPRGLVRGNFPINMRSAEADEAGNCFSQGSFTFDLNYSSRVDLVWRVKRQIDAIKVSPRPIIDQFILNALVPRLPLETLMHVLLDSFGKYTMMLSNVPGPAGTGYVGGEPTDDISFYCFNTLGTYCGLCSYNGMVSMSVCCDASVLGDPYKLGRYWKEEFDLLYEEAMAHKDGVPIPVNTRGISRTAVLAVAIGLVAPLAAVYFWPR